jgi:DNA-binding NtrC family response regulator
MTKKKILVVEDEGLLAMTIEEWLESFGYDVVDIASSAKEAIKSTKKHKPDLIIVDVFLDGEMDGIEAVAHINKHHNIPVIYITGNTDLDTYYRARKTVHYGYHEKPLSKVRLKKTVHETFEFIDQVAHNGMPRAQG